MIPRPTSPAAPNQLVSPWQALAKPSVLWSGLYLLVPLSIFFFKGQNNLDFFGFALIVCTALLPSYLWCYRRTYGIPIFPLYSLCTIWTFALPLVNDHPLVSLYPELSRFEAALTVASTTLAGTFSWYLFSSHLCRPRAYCLALKEKNSDWIFFLILITGVFFNIALTSLLETIPGGFFSLVKQMLIALENIALFSLAYGYGKGRLKTNQRLLFNCFFSALIISSLPSLYLITSASYVVLALGGYVLGRGKVPWLLLVPILGLLVFLHQGKAQMREKYWAEDHPQAVTPMDYPEFAQEWINASLDNFIARKGSPFEGPQVEDHESFITRSSLMHLLLMEQSLTPSTLPYLNGKTYTIVPELLVPRFLNNNKIVSMQVVDMLPVYYGLIDPNQPVNTCIGFGLLNESYANFGYLGCLMFSVILGGFYGFTAYFSATYPLLSLRSLFAIVVLALSFQSEFTMGIYVPALFQSCAVLLLISFLFMKKIPVPGY